MKREDQSICRKAAHCGFDTLVEDHLANICTMTNIADERMLSAAVRQGADGLLTSYSVPLNCTACCLPAHRYDYLLHISIYSYLFHLRALVCTYTQVKARPLLKFSNVWNLVLTYEGVPLATFLLPTTYL